FRRSCCIFVSFCWAPDRSERALGWSVFAVFPPAKALPGVFQEGSNLGFEGQRDGSRGAFELAVAGTFCWSGLDLAANLVPGLGLTEESVRRARLGPLRGVGDDGRAQSGYALDATIEHVDDALHVPDRALQWLPEALLVDAAPSSRRPLCAH